MEDLLKMQAQLMEVLGISFGPQASLSETESVIKNALVGVAAEATEAYEAFTEHNKPWKKMSEAEAKQHFEEEVVDALFMWMEVIITYNMSFEEVKSIYYKKYRRNLIRTMQSGDTAAAERATKAFIQFHIHDKVVHSKTEAVSDVDWRDVYVASYHSWVVDRPITDIYDPHYDAGIYQLWLDSEPRIEDFKQQVFVKAAKSSDQKTFDEKAFDKDFRNWQDRQPAVSDHDTRLYRKWLEERPLPENYLDGT